MPYTEERDFIISRMQEAFDRFARDARKQVQQKSEFDLVTSVDTAVEQFLTDAILTQYPGDRIHAEEFAADTLVIGRTWVIDPIDGTVNMAREIPQYGMQLALFDKGEPMLAVIYLPFWNCTLWAIKGMGCWCNDQQVRVDRAVTLNNALINFCDYTHKSQDLARRQWQAQGFVHPKVSKIRMYGAACIDFAATAMGKTHGTVMVTKNRWDIAPGLLLCKEAGGVISNLDGAPYEFGADGVLVGANEELLRLLQQGFAHGD